MSMSVQAGVCMCVCVCSHICGGPCRPEESVESPGVGVIGDRKSSSVESGNQTQESWEVQKALVTPEPPLQPFTLSQLSLQFFAYVHSTESGSQGR